MKNYVVIAGIILLVLAGALMLWRNQVKSKSPEDGVDFIEGDLKIHVYYNRPYKKGREIFARDGLVPFGKVWRTGANEPTYIETNKILIIKGQELKPGKYSIWTIPDEHSWKVIFNSEYPSWGINFNGEANRNPETDVVNVEVPTAAIDTEIEQFTISIERIDEEELELIFQWDKTLVAVPFIVVGQ
jgi:hypothetical protein